VKENNLNRHIYISCKSSQQNWFLRVVFQSKKNVFRENTDTQSPQTECTEPVHAYLTSH